MRVQNIPLHLRCKWRRLELLPRSRTLQTLAGDQEHRQIPIDVNPVFSGKDKGCHLPDDFIIIPVASRRPYTIRDVEAAATTDTGLGVYG